MKKILMFLVAWTIRLALSLRYRVKVKGLEKLTKDNLSRSGGVLFLPNHPALFVDPGTITLAVYPKFPIRPMIVEYMYFTPGVHWLMKKMNALPVPNFETSNNSLKRKRHEKVMEEVVKGLKKGENFLLYPAGRLKHTGIEKIGGASAAHDLIEQVPEANIVLVRIHGLWGSSFSRALTGAVPSLGATLKKGFYTILKNLIFFTPRRELTIEFEPAPADFPRNASRLEMNRWLEQWYNKPDGFSGDSPGETLRLVSYSFWKNEIPEPYKIPEEPAIAPNFKDVDPQVYDKVMAKLVDLTELDLEAIKPHMSLYNDLGLDSLDQSDLSLFLQEQFELPPIPVTEMTTVERLLAIASKKIVLDKKLEEEKIDLSKWHAKRPHRLVELFKGKTIIETFLNGCDVMGKSPAYADDRSGILTYARVKLAVVLLAEKFRKMPGASIGILLPASSAAFICVLACQLAGKVPVMVNWTIGPRHLRSVAELAKLDVVLTSWAFLERLDTVDLAGIDDKLVMLETVRREVSLFGKVQAFIRSKMSAKRVLKLFGANKIQPEDPAVLLFTSGTESMPKGVPLSHRNILCNQGDALKVVKIYGDDVLLSLLPPFHSFGLCLTGLIGLLCGIRTAFYPNPTDGEGLAKSFERWGATLTAGAPIFIKGLLRASKPGQLDTMRLCITGAEKTPQDLIDLIASMGKKECLLEGYGITECSPIISANFPGQPLRGVGKPLPSVELIIVHLETHEVLPQGEEGLILVRGPSIFAGYLNPDQASPFLMVEGKEWYNTGDIGYLDSEENLYISGRKKRFIKIGGEMVSLGAIEAAISTAAAEKAWDIHSEGAGLAVLGKELPGGKSLLLLVTTIFSNPDEINQILRQQGLSNLVRISSVITIDEMPLMGTGKINYRLLEETYFDKSP